jgi:hypothetical protein
VVVNQPSPSRPLYVYPGGGTYYPGIGNSNATSAILSQLVSMLPGANNYQPYPGVSPTGRFFVNSNITGSGILNGSLPIINQYGGIAGLNYGNGGYGYQNPNLGLLPPGVALNMAYNTLPGIPMTQAPLNYNYGYNPYLGNPYMNPYANPYLWNMYLGGPWAGGGLISNPAPQITSPNQPNPLFKGLGNGGYGL